MSLVVEFSTRKQRKHIISTFVKKVTASFPDEAAEVGESDFNLEKWFESNRSLNDEVSISSMTIKADNKNDIRKEGKQSFPTLIYVTSRRQNNDNTSIASDDYSFQSNLPF